MPLPQDTRAAPPVWDAATSFQCSFEDNEDWNGPPMWDAVGDVTISGTGEAADGDKYASVAPGGSLFKHINNCATFWVRASFRILSVPALDRQLLLVADTQLTATLFSLTYEGASHCIVCSLTGQAWPRTGKWQTVEYLVDVIGARAYAWFDGT